MIGPVETTTGPPPGWYHDPGDRTWLRYWDGVRWTGWIADRGEVRQAPITAQDAERVWRERADLRARWPGWVAVVAVLAALASGALAVGTVRAGDALGLDGPAAELGLGVLGLHTGLLTTCWAVHVRRGTGAGFFADYGLAYRPGDWWRGLIGSFVARAGAVVLAIVALLWSTDFVGTNVEPYEDEVDLTLGLVLLFGLVAVVLAPIVEELFFRGLLMRSLEAVAPAWLAVTVQAVLFGLAHVTVDLGAGNVAVVASITAAGATFGIIARQFNRLAPAMFAHAWFNVLPFLGVVLLYLVGD